jgi:hypothetical protein
MQPVKQPLKLSIPGSFWDSQIYSGELSVLGSEGELHRIDWRAFVDQLAVAHSSAQTGLRIAFSDSDLLYNPQVRRILMDPALREPIEKQLEKAAQQHLESMSLNDANKNLWSVTQSPFKFLPTDTEIYYNKLFATGEKGLFSASRSRAVADLVGENLQKHHDASMLQVRASASCTALAATAGSDGLFEFSLARQGSNKVIDKERHVAKNPCSACDWSFKSVLGWGDEKAFLASFIDKEDQTGRKKTREFVRVIEQDEIFPDAVFTTNARMWGSREKIYCAQGEEVFVADFSPAEEKKNKKDGAAKKTKESFETRGSYKLDARDADVVATGTAPFGTIVEFSDRLVVYRSDGGSNQFDGELVHWRVFPRSEHYSNQLHLIYEDRLDVVSFVHDYFVDQDQKLSGFSRSAANINS